MKLQKNQKNKKGFLPGLSNHMIKNIIFDIGGVVVIKGRFNAFMKLMAKAIFGTTNPEFFKEEEISKKVKTEWHQWSLGKLTAKQFFDMQRKKYHLKLSTNRMAYLLYHSQKQSRPIVSLIKKLKSKYAIYALTNHTKEWFIYQTKQYDYNALFSGIMTSFEAKSAKPNIMIYKKLLKKYNLNPKECVFIAHQAENLLPAKKLGMETIFYVSSKKLKTDLKKHGVI